MSKKNESISEEELNKIDAIFDLNYKTEEYKASEYLYNAEWGGADKILEIEKSADTKKEIYDAEFDIFWKFYIKNLVEFDSKANKFKSYFQRLQLISIIFTLVAPQLISFITLVSWADYDITTDYLFTIPVILTFLSALFMSFIGLKKYEQLYMNYRLSAERLKSLAFKFQFDESFRRIERKNKFIKDVITVIEQQHAGFEGIFMG